MNANDLIRWLQALPERDRTLPIVSYELSMLVELEPPRVGFRDRQRRETHDDQGERVLIL